MNNEYMKSVNNVSTINMYILLIYINVDLYSLKVWLIRVQSKKSSEPNNKRNNY